MKVPIEDFKNTESGPVVILGNGPSLNAWVGTKFACPVIGINRSVDYWPEQDYFVTVSFDRLGDVALGKITAKKAVFSCLHKANDVLDRLIDQPVTYADMSYEDVYYAAPQKGQKIFDPDLTKPTYKTFGGLYAIQAGLFLGFNPAYLIGFDGGDEKFYGYNPRAGEASPEYHNACLWSVAVWIEDHPEYKIYNCSKETKIEWFPFADPPTEKCSSECKHLFVPMVTIEEILLEQPYDGAVKCELCGHHTTLGEEE